jgi:DUF2892 family protein
MRRNVSNIDAGIRVAIACALLFLAARYNDSPLPALGFALTALFVFSTALDRRCPLYTLLGIDR